VNRKQRRALKKNKTDISEKVALFDKLPNECLACQKPFDKKNREMVFTWNVVIREGNTVRLYCPECWSMATDTVKKYHKEKNNECE